MKKILSAVAAFGLVAGMAATASAMNFSMSGQYTLEGVMLSGASGQDKTFGLGDGKDGGVDPYDDDASTDSAWLHTFIVKPQLQVNDKITVFSELRFARYNVWGGGNNYGGDTGKSPSDITNIDDREQSNIDVYTLYMEYMSPVGKIRAGRCAVPPWGGDFLSTYDHADRLMWYPSFVADPFSADPFSLLVFIQKSQENDWYTDNSDSDSDVYEIDLTYKTDNLLLMGGYNYFDNKTGSDYNGLANYDAQNHRLRAYGVANIDMFTIEAEWGWRFGDYRNYDVESVLQQDRDVDAMAAMVDATAKMDKLNVGLMYFWAEGQSDTGADRDMEAAMDGALEDGIGDDFDPFYILTGRMTGMLNSDLFNADSNMTTAGVNCIGVHADYQVSDKLSLHGAVGYAWADDTNYLEKVTYETSIDDEYGWEVDLGAKYKLLDNLTYEVHAGYFNTGDFFDDISSTEDLDSDDVYLLSHQLTMTF